MTKIKYSDFPTPKLIGRQEVRDLLNDFFAQYYQPTSMEFNPRELFEKLVNDIIDLAVKESNQKE